MKGEAGFTLLEVIVAMVILGIGFTILTQGYLMINDGMDRNQDYTFISSWAASKMNEISSGVELNSHGSFNYREKIYNWWIEEVYLDESLKKVSLIVKKAGSTADSNYLLTRLFIRTN